jgi:hypothetical protein
LAARAHRGRPTGTACSASADRAAFTSLATGATRRRRASSYGCLLDLVFAASSTSGNDGESRKGEKLVNAKHG